MSVVVHCGMPDEFRVLTKALKPGTLILSGAAKLNLPTLVPPTCTRLLGMGVAGGLSPHMVVPDVAMAAMIFRKTGPAYPADGAWNARAMAAARKTGITLHPVDYYSDGLQNEANDPQQRAALFKQYGVEAIDDELRFTVAEAQRRGIPVNCVRPLSDDYRAKLPPLATGQSLNPDGSPNLAHLATALGEDDQGSESVLKVMADYSASLDALEAVAKALASLIASEA
jgi:hypothetical protein